MNLFCTRIESSGRRTLFLHSICCMALCEPAATERKSKNTHGLSQMQRSLFTDLFFDFCLDFLFDFYFDFDFRFDFDCTLTGQGGFKTDFV